MCGENAYVPEKLQKKKWRIMGPHLTYIKYSSFNKMVFYFREKSYTIELKDVKLEYKL